MAEDNKQTQKKQQHKQKEPSTLDFRLDSLLECYEDKPILILIHLRWMKEDKQKPRRVFSIIQ